MTRNGIGPEAQDNIVQGISFFAMYGFPESHAASFALIAYASAYLKVHYLAAFTCAHAQQSADGLLLARCADQGCAAPRPARAAHRRATLGMALHAGSGTRWLALAPHRLQLCQGSAAVAAADALRAGAHTAPASFRIRRRPGCCAFPNSTARNWLRLARIGALNSLGGVEHRRDALWQVEEAGTRGRARCCAMLGMRAIEARRRRPLRQMSDDERLAADYCRNRPHHRPAPHGLSPRHPAQRRHSVGRRTCLLHE